MTDTMICKATSGTFARSDKPTAKSYYTASKTTAYVGSPYYTYIVTTMPARVARRQIISARLEFRTTVKTGSYTTAVQRIAKPSKAMTGINWANRPAVLAGSAAASLTQSGATTVRSHDVTADVKAYMAGAAFYGWRLSSTLTTPWAIYGWGSKYPPQLIVEYSDTPTTPTGVSPAGVTSLAAPTITWQAPDGIASARVQVDVDGGAFTSPLFDSGDVATTVAQLNLSALGWGGQANGGTVNVRVRYTNEAGTSPWSQPIVMTRLALPGPVTVTGPPSPSPDPSPTVVWSCPGQTRFQVLTYVDNKLVDNSGVQPGNDTAWTTAKGATKSGQAIRFRVRCWDSNARTASPGDPGYAEGIRDVVYTPGTAAPITNFTATQGAGGAPWVDLLWDRLVNGQQVVADEWLIIRNGDIIDRIDGVGANGDPLWYYRDWGCPPNTKVTYTVRPIINGAAGSGSATLNVQTIVTGAWIFDPTTGDWFVVTGENLSLGYEESTVRYELVGAPTTRKRTFALRGLSGTIAGRLDDDRTGGLAAAEADLFDIKSNPSSEMRCALGEDNFPCTIDQISPVVDYDNALYDRMVKQVSLYVAQTGELPFSPITPATASS